MQQMLNETDESFDPKLGVVHKRAALLYHPTEMNNIMNCRLTDSYPFSVVFVV